MCIISSYLNDRGRTTCVYICVKDTMGCSGNLRESCCVCGLGVSSCPLSYSIFSNAGPERALTAVLCLFFEALRIVGNV